MADARHALVFASVLAFVALVGIAVASKIVSLPLVLAALIIIGVGAWVAPQLVEFKEYERGVVFRFGRFDRLAGPGWSLIFPRFERYERVDMRTQAIDLPPQDTITSDNIKLKVDAIAFWRVKDPVKVILEVRDPQPKLTQVLISEIRVAVGKLTMEQALISTDQINQQLSVALENVAKQWGIQVTRVELQHIELPESLSAAMRKRQEAIEYKAKVETEAMAKQVALETVDKAVSQLSDKTMTYLYLESLKAVADGRSTKILFPLELSKLAQSLSNKVGINGGTLNTGDLAILAKSLLKEEPKAKVEGSVGATASTSPHPLREITPRGRAS